MSHPKGFRHGARLTEVKLSLDFRVHARDETIDETCMGQARNASRQSFEFHDVSLNNGLFPKFEQHQLVVNEC